MATPSEARVSVEVIATKDHFTQLLSMTHLSIHKRADNCRDRAGMTHSFHVHRTARRPSRPCAARWDKTLGVAATHIYPRRKAAGIAAAAMSQASERWLERAELRDTCRQRSATGPNARASRKVLPPCRDRR